METKYPDPMLQALIEEEARLTDLLLQEQNLRTTLRYASTDTYGHFKGRLAEVQQQIAVLQGTAP